jgi:hypothetical protein
MTHFPAMLLFALFTSIIFGITQRAQPKMMIRFGSYCFALFVSSVIVVSWIMWAIKH